MHGDFPCTNATPRKKKTKRKHELLCSFTGNTHSHPSTMNGVQKEKKLRGGRFKVLKKKEKMNSFNFSPLSPPKLHLKTHLGVKYHFFVK